MTGDARKIRPSAPITRPRATRAFALVLSLVVGCSAVASADPGAGFTIAQLKYHGGGDWYANPTALPNLLAGISSRTDLKVAERPANVAPDDDELFLYPMIHMTGHGRVAFTDEEVAALREYFERGGFLWADDNYGMDRHLRAQLDRVLPGSPLVELPFDHEIYQLLL